MAQGGGHWQHSNEFVDYLSVLLTFQQGLFSMKLVR